MLMHDGRWSIELHKPKIRFQKVDKNYVNAVLIYNTPSYLNIHRLIGSEVHDSNNMKN